MKSKKIIWGVIFGLDIGLTLFFLITTIIMLATMPSNIDIALNYYQDNYIGYLQKNSNMFLVLIVIPMLVLFVANAVGLIIYALKTRKRTM